MAQYDGSIRINTDIITKNIKPKVQELEESLREIGEKAEKARIKLENLDKANVSHRSEEYKEAQTELESFVNAYKDIAYKIIDYGNQVDSAISFDSSKIDEAHKKLDMLDISGISHSDKEYKEAERNLNHLIDAQERYQEIVSQFDAPIKNALEGMKNLISETDKYLSASESQIIDFDKHWNQLRGEVEEYANSLKELHDQGKFFGDEDYDKLYLAWKNATDAVKAYQSELNKQTEAGQAKIAEQEAKAAEKKEAEQRRVEEQAERALQKENARIQKEIENQAKLEAREAERKAKEEARIAAIQAKEEAKRAKEVAAIQEQEAEEQRLAEIRENAVVGSQRIINVIERRKQLLQEIKDLEQAGITQGYEDYNKRQQELAQLNQEIKEYSDNVKSVKDAYKKLANAAKKAFDSIGKILKKVNSIVDSFGNRIKKIFSDITKSSNNINKNAITASKIFKNILKYGLGIRSVYILVNKLRTAIKEGFTNLYNDPNMEAFKNTVDSLKASILTLKNSFAAAFRPIVDVAIPYIQRLIDYIVQLMNVVGQFMAAITGQKTYTKAIKQTTAAIEDQNKAQNKQLSNLDNLNNLTSDAGAGADIDGSVMLEEVPIENKFKDFANQVQDIMSKLFDPLKEAWNSVGENVMSAWKGALNNIWSLIKDIGHDFLTVWQEERTLNIFKNILGIIEDIGLAIGNIAENFQKAWDKNDTGLKILQNIRNIIDVIVANIKHAADATVVWAANLDFTPLLEAFERFTASLEPVADTLSGILTDFYEQVLLPLGKWTLEKGIPELLDVFTAFNEKVDWAALRENLSEFWNHLEPFAETVGEGLIIFIERVSDLVANFLNSETFVNFLHDLEDWMDNVTPEDVADGIEKLIKALVGLKIAVIGLTALKGLAEFTILMTNFGKAVSTVGETISGSKIAGAIASLGGLKGILTADLTTVFGAGTATEIGVILGTGILAALAGALAGGLEADFLNHNVIGPIVSLFDKELGAAYKNFKWFGEGGFFSTLNLEDFKSAISEVKKDFDKLAEGIPQKWDNIKEIFKNTNEEIRNQLGFLKDNFQKTNEEIGNKFKSLKETFKNTNSEIAESLKFLGGEFSKTWGYIKSDLSQVWTSIKATASEKWNSITSSISSAVDKIKDKIDGFISKIKEAIQSVKDFFASGISKIGSKIGEAFSFGNSSSESSTFSTRATSAPYTANPAFSALSTTPIPKLATGAVIPANREFLAVLGDQKHGTNVEAPLSTIEEAVMNAMAKVNANNANNGGEKVTIEIPVIIKGIGEIGRAVQQFDTEFFKQSGRHAFT